MVTTEEDVAEAKSPAARVSRVPYVVALGFYTVFVARTSTVVDGKRYFPLFDDAMISLTYARNLARGHGLVWNAGGARVEGITNPLWTAVMAVPQVLHVPESWTGLVVAAIAAGILLGCGRLAYALVRALAPDVPVAATAATWLVLFCYPLVFWSLRGMEVALLTLCALAAAILALRVAAAPNTRDQRLLALVCAVGVLTRIDFTVFVVPIAAYLFCQRPAADRMRVAGRFTAVMAGVLVAQEIVRRVYYHAWVPNTYTLKVGNTAVSDRLARGILATGFTATVTCSVIFVFAVWCVARRRNPAFVLVSALALAPFLYTIWVGGDAWEWMRYPDRYLVPGVVMLICLACIGVCDFVEHLRHGGQRRALVGGILGLLGVLVAFGLTPGGGRIFEGRADLGAPSLQPISVLPVAILVLVAGSGMWLGKHLGVMQTLLLVGLALPLSVPAGVSWLQNGAIYQTLDQSGVNSGLLVRDVTLPGARIGVSAAGAVMYYSGRTGVDILGKSDPLIARLKPRPETGFWPGHMKWNYDISLGQERPDVVSNLWIIRCDEVQHFLDWGYRVAHAIPSVAARSSDQALLVLQNSPHVRWDQVVVGSAEDTTTALQHHCFP
jgi:hypothetical protein